MSTDAKMGLRIGEKRPIFIQETGQTGDILSVGSPTFTLYDSTGSVVSGFNAVAAQNDPPAQSVKIYYNLDSTSLTAGAWYTGFFSYNLTDSADSITRSMRPVGAIYIAPRVEATYDPSTLIGQTRLMMADTDVSNANFSDVEITVFLGLTASVPTLAASMALMSAASDAARLCILSRFNADGVDLTKLADALREQAQALLRYAPALPIVNSPDQMFSTDSDGGMTLGTLHIT